MGIEIPKIEVRFENLSVEGDVYDGNRALPTLINVTLNTFEVLSFPFSPSNFPFLSNYIHKISFFYLLNITFNPSC